MTAREPSAWPARARVDMIRLGCYLEGRLVGYTFGWHEGDLKFYTALSGVHPEHRRRGIYSELVRRTVAWASERGYGEVWSRHLPTNSPVIMAKLKEGFFISGFEVSASIGCLVAMRYFIDEGAKEAFAIRCGAQRLSERYLPQLGPKEEG